MSENFNRAIQDLDSRDPRAFNDARHAILNEIQTHRNVDPRQIVDAVNRVENQPGHAHNDIVLTHGPDGYLDIAPANYGDNRGYAPVPPPQYGYEQGPYSNQRPGITPGEAIGGAVAAGVIGGLIGGALSGRRRY